MHQLIQTIFGKRKFLRVQRFSYTKLLINFIIFYEVMSIKIIKHNQDQTATSTDEN